MRWIEDDGSVFEYSYRKVKKKKKKRKSRKSAADDVDGLAKVVRNVSFNYKNEFLVKNLIR